MIWLDVIVLKMDVKVLAGKESGQGGTLNMLILVKVWIG
jgi:hypothetical protein